MADHEPVAQPGGDALLVARGVTKTFGGVAAVQGVSFSIFPGESVGLVGPNGAGKTTLFNCITGQLRPDGGEVIFQGRPLDSLPAFRRARRGIGRTFQRIEVFPEMSVADHLLVALRGAKGEGSLLRDLLNLSKPTAEEQSRVQEVLELIGIAGEAETPVAALGLGSCRLVELARALVARPKLLMADEPSSGLDVQETSELSSVLRTVQRDGGVAVLLVEHDLNMVGEVVDRTLVMDLGCLISQGSFDEVMASPAVRQAYLGKPA